MAPWWIKLYSKLVLSRMPLSYGSWAKMNVFRHGAMNEEGYARKVFDRHVQGFEISGACMEFGPGDSLYTAILAAAAGFDGSYLIDVGRYASDDLAEFQAIARSNGIDEQRVAGWTSVDGALADLNSSYLTKGLASLKSLPDASVNFIFSQAVLEHVRKAEYREFIAESYRVLAPGGRCSHRVDLKDHLQAGLNNLRFSDATWESDFFSKSGFYTNRLTMEEHLLAFTDAGFKIDRVAADRFGKQPIARRQLAPQFRSRTDDQLMTSGFDLIASKS